MQPTNTNSSTLWGGILALSALVAYVILEAIGSEAASLTSMIGFISPFIAVLLIAKQNDKIQETVDEVRKNTNGALTKKIDDIADAAAQRALSTQEDYPNGR